MEDQVTKLEVIRDLMLNSGRELILALIILIIGIMLVKWVTNCLRKFLSKYISNPTIVSIVSNSVGVLLLMVVILTASVQAGMSPKPVMRLLTIICLTAIGIIALFRPLLPTLPFKVGQTVKFGNLLGVVEATTVLNTRLRTFDGKTFYVPNRQILDDIVINYHHTVSRRIKINVGIRYDQDLIKAKQILEEIMIGDPRVLPKPSPVVWVLDLTSNCIELGARCWAPNQKFWLAKCDLTEKIKFRFDSEGIVIAYPQMDVHHYNTYQVHSMDDQNPHVAGTLLDRSLDDDEV